MPQLSRLPSKSPSPVPPSSHPLSRRPTAAPPSDPGLNPAQREAVMHLHSPCLVLAGAGSGKTRVITHKIARLLDAGLLPRQIAAITFTNKAAQEMRERSRHMVGAKAARELVVCTFHALGVRILREDGQAMGLKSNFSILDSDDVLSLLREAGGTTDAAMARRWQWTISLWKNQGLTAEQAGAQAQTDDDRVAARVMARYQERLAAYQAVDFDELIGLPVRLLSDHADVRARWQDRLRHVLVDEVQDTNATQYDLLKLLVGAHAPAEARFTAVGDDDQSIYGWRGATLDNLRQLPQDFPTLKLIKLEQNYRSTGAILRAANHVIAANPKLFEKQLWSELGEGEPVRVQGCDNEEHEAQRLVARIQTLRSAATPWSQIAVLYRANHQARIMEQALRKAEIPYKVSGGQSYFDRAEIKDLCAWLRLLANPDDDPAFLRAVATPKRGIGHQTLASLGTFANQWRVSLFESLFAESLASAVSARAMGGLHEFGRYVADLSHRAEHTRGAEDARELLLGWLKDIGYEQHLFDGEDNQKLAASRWGNVLEFVDWIARRCGGEVDETGQVSESDTVLKAAQTIALITTLAERGDNAEQVTLSTLHAAKGLEWDHVVLAGINEGLLPFRSEDDEMTAQRLEEERRLMYVGITRARRTLVVDHLHRRKRGRDSVAGTPSRFIAEMKLDAQTTREDPRERLKALRAEFAARAAAAGDEGPASAPGSRTDSTPPATGTGAA